MRIWRLTFAIILCLAFACAQDAFAQSDPGAVQIRIPAGASTQCGPACFVPSDIEISKNTTVSWQNNDIVSHTITSGQPSDNATGMLFDSGLVPPGGHFEHMFGTTGIFRYFDQVHPWATGVVRVVPNPSSVQPLITVSTDRDTYYGGDTITITGATNRFLSSSVMVTILDPHKNPVLSQSVPMHQDTSSYIDIITADKRFALPGTYEVDASYGMANSKTSFDFNIVAPTEQILKTTLENNEHGIPQGGSAQIGFDFKLDQGYTMGVVNLSLEGAPDGVLSWINPPRLDSSINSNHTKAAEIPIFVNSGAKPGIYTIHVIGNGNILNGTSNKDVQFQQQRIASIPLKIMPSGSTVSLEVGKIDFTQTTFCTDTEPSGHMCTGFVSHEEFPITVRSDTNQEVRLDAIKVPDDGYIKFLPDTVHATTTGSSSRMIMAGIMEPFGINPYDTTAMAVRARTLDDSTAVSYIPIIDSGEITVLSKPSPIKIEGNLISSGSQTQIIPFGVVYDPTNGPRTLAVKLKALGLVNGSDIVPFTKSFGVKIPRDSFVLNSSEPYYFMVESISKNLPSGRITFALGEDEGETQFVQNVTLEISNVIHGGINLGGISQVGPGVKIEKAQYPQPSGSWTIPAIIGGVAGGGGAAVVFLVLGRKPS